MDDLDLAKMLGVSSTGVAIVLIVYRVLKSVKGKTFVSKCCGRKVDFSVDVKESEPTPKDTVNPMICPETAKPKLETV